MSILIKNLAYIATFDDQDTMLPGGSILIDGPVIKAVGPAVQAESAEMVIDGSGKLALPGFVNTHHHFFQQLTRSVPAVHSATVLEWLRYSYPIWAWLDEEAMHYATLLSVAQLLLTGCTTTSDLAYFFPRRQGQLFDTEIAAAHQVGIRFYPCRASMPSMESNLFDQLTAQGVRAAELTEDFETILTECERVIQTYHRPEPYSMCQIAIGQTDKTYHQPGFMRDMADLAARHGVMLHTHLHPRDDEITLCQSLYQKDPLDFLDEVGWLGPHSFFAHATNFTMPYIERVARAGAGITHSPSSNMKLSYRLPSLPAMVAQGVKVSVAVDGGASNDTGDYLGELRLTLLVHRIRGLHPDPYGGVNATSPYGVLKLGTRGGAAVLNRTDIGSLEVGKAADIVLYDLNRLDFAGGLHDPLGALLLCGENHRVDTSIVNGEILVRDGKLTRMDEAEITAGANRAAARMLKQAGVSL